MLKQIEDYRLQSEEKVDEIREEYESEVRAQRMELKQMKYREIERN